jgi:energy-coupling factor transport system permease protein
VAITSRAAFRAVVPGSEGGVLHESAWLAWLVAASVMAFLTSNPLYLSLAFLAVCAVHLSLPDTPKRRMLVPVVLIGLFFSVLSIPFNVLTGSSGPTVLASMPELRFPSWFGGAAFGGPITGEALVTATERALTISTLVVAAAAFNASIDHFRLVRLAPRSLAHAMLVLTIAIIVVPQAVDHARRVGEARRLRGREGRGIRALPSLLLPVLQGALERSVQRAESLEARGFGAGVPAAGWRLSIAGVVGLGLCAWGAFAHFYYGDRIESVAALLLGAALVGAAVVRMGGAKQERLRNDRLSTRDLFVLGAAVASVLLVLALRIAGADDVSYLAYPQLAAPAFGPLGAVAFVLLIAPALAAYGGSSA